MSWVEDRDEVAMALLRSEDFLQHGFSARRPLGNRSLIAADVWVAMGRDEEDMDLEYAQAVWAEMPAHMPDFITRVLAGYKLRQAEKRENR